MKKSIDLDVELEFGNELPVARGRIQQAKNFDEIKIYYRHKIIKEINTQRCIINTSLLVRAKHTC